MVSATFRLCARFTGLEAKPAGLYYYRARYYHSGLQRFISEDPIGFAGSNPNLYVYVDNSPIGATDPTGEGMSRPVLNLRSE
ncbi:MAG: RHS repeat-associated core domain-containing protein [Candidatus Rokuibacteriota bacterium]